MRGQSPQVYLVDHHEAIVPRSMFEAVQGTRLPAGEPQSRQPTLRAVLVLRKSGLRTVRQSVCAGAGAHRRTAVYDGVKRGHGVAACAAPAVGNRICRIVGEANCTGFTNQHRGGIAADLVLPDGCRVLHALSLPGKGCATSRCTRRYSIPWTPFRRASYEQTPHWLWPRPVRLYAFPGHAGYTSHSSSAAIPLRRFCPTAPAHSTRFGTAHWRQELTTLTGVSLSTALFPWPIGPKGAVYALLIDSLLFGNVRSPRLRTV